MKTVSGVHFVIFHFAAYSISFMYCLLQKTECAFLQYVCVCMCMCACVRMCVCVHMYMSMYCKFLYKTGSTLTPNLDLCT